MSIIYDILREKKNLFMRRLGLLHINTAAFALTTRCDLKCLICDFGRWRSEDHRELSLTAIETVLLHPMCQKVTHIGITGGEPFLYPDLFGLRQMLFQKKPDANVTISSNGTMTHEIMDYFMAKEGRNKTILELSFLGITAHDQVSGMNGSFGRLKETIRAVDKFCPDVMVRSKFTITPQNYQDIFDVVRFCKKQKKPLILKLIENVSAHQNMSSYSENLNDPAFNFSPPQKKKIVKELKRCKHAKILYNKRHVQYMIDWLEGRSIDRPCFANEKSLFVNQEKKIYFCRMFQPVASIDDMPDLRIEKIYKNRPIPHPHMCKGCISIFRSIL